MTIFKPALALMLVSISACSGPPAEFILVIDSDMPAPPPSRNDSVQIDVIVTDSQQIRTSPPTISYELSEGLPATVAFLAPDDLRSSVTINVVGKQHVFEDPNQPNKVTEILRMRTLFASFQDDDLTSGTAMLSFLCANSAMPDPLMPGSFLRAGSCAPEQQCIGGWCQQPLPSTRVAAESGGGCFDAVGCFDDAPILPLPKAMDVTCEFDVPGDLDNLNVAMVTADSNEGDGTCGVNGCYIPLNRSDWIESGPGKITLPCEACRRIVPDHHCVYDAGPVPGLTSFKPPGDPPTKPTLKGIKVAHCAPTKTVNVPTCGLRSKVSKGPVTPYSIVLASKQAHPVAIALNKGEVYWINSGTFDSATGNFKNNSTLMRRGDPIALGSGSINRLRDLAIVGGLVVWTESALASASGTVWCAPIGGDMKYVASVPVMGNPGPIAGAGSTIYWGQPDAIQKATVSLSDAPSGSSKCVLTVGEKTVLSKDSGVTKPTDIVMTGNGVCWAGTGGLDCTGLNPPAIHDNPLVAIFSDAGKPALGAIIDVAVHEISGVDLSNPKEPSPVFFPVPIAMNPSGIAVDASYIYWTDWLQGTVKRVPTHPSNPLVASTPELLAEGQDHPSAIVVDEHTIYWVNEGSVFQPTGSIVARAK